MDLKERNFRLQVFQQSLSTLCMYPLRLYKNSCYEVFLNAIGKDLETIHQKLCPNEPYEPKRIIEVLQKTIKENPKSIDKELFELFEPYSEDLRESIWETKPSNSLTFIRDIKDNKRLWIFLMIYDLFPRDFIDKNFKELYKRDCLIGMRNIFVKLDDHYTLSVGRLFTKEQDSDSVVRNLLENYDFDNLNIFELTKISRKRKFYDEEELKCKIKKIKKAFEIFLQSVSKLPDNINKEEIEEVAIFIYMVTRDDIQKDAFIRTSKLSLNFKKNRLTVEKNNNNQPHYTAEYKDCIRKIENYKDFFLGEYASRIKTSFTKKYSGLRNRDSFSPVEELLERICNRLEADGGCYIEYNISDEKLKLEARYGDKAYTDGIKVYVDKINDKQTSIENKSRVLKVISNYFNSEYQYDINKLILHDLTHDTILQPIIGIDNCILSNIAIPVTFRHKLLGVLLIDSFREGNFTKNDINLILSISNALSVQIFDQIIEKNLFQIMESVPNQAELQDKEALKKKFKHLTTYMTNIFFSYGVSIWEYNTESSRFTLKSTTLPIKEENSIEASSGSEDLLNDLVPRYEEADFECLEEFSIKSSKQFICFNPRDYDKRINCVKIYPIRQQNRLIGAFSIYNRSKEDYRAIDEQSLKSVHDHMKVFFNIIDTFKQQKELVHSHALHEISARLNMINDKTMQLKELLFSKFKELDAFSRDRFSIKLGDIENLTNNTRLSFKYIANKSDETHYKNHVDDEIENMYKDAYKQCDKINNIRHIINELTNSIPYPYNSKNIRINNLIDNRLDLCVNNLILSDIFQNLLFNALKYSFQGTAITIYSKVKSNSLRLYIKSEGLKIYDDEKNDIFKYGFRSFSARNFEEEIGGENIQYLAGENENLGVGLYKCNELVSKILSGEIRLKKEKSAIKEGSINIFEIILPIKLLQKGMKA